MCVCVLCKTINFLLFNIKKIFQVNKGNGYNNWQKENKTISSTML